MRIPLIALALPALALGQAQEPLVDQVSSWMSKLKSYVPGASPAHPLDAGASVVAETQLKELTTTNWETVLAPSYHANTGTFGPDNWMVLVTGKNRTCAGRCGPLEAEYNTSIALLTADKNPPHFGILNCDNYGVLCSTWLAGPPTLWYIQVPQKVVDGAPEAEKKTAIYVLPLNVSATTAKDFVSIHKEKQYTKVDPMDSMFHPFDGQLVKLGLQKPLGYVLFTFSMVPSWGLMVGISFLTRQFVNNRAGNRAAMNRANAMRNRPLGGAPAADGR